MAGLSAKVIGVSFYRFVIVLAIVCSVASGVLFCSVPAFAVQGHVCNGVFGEKGAGDGQLGGPEGIAVNESTGTVYVVDSANNRVEYFSSAGVYQGQFDGSGLLSGEVTPAPAGAFVEPQTIAVDNSEDVSDPSRGDVYVVDGGHNVVDKFTVGGQFVGQLTGTPSRVFRGVNKSLGAISVAVDAAGQLWVAFPAALLTEGEKLAARFTNDLENQFVEEWREPAFGFLSPGLAVGPHDDLYFHGKYSIGSEFVEAVDKLSGTGEILNAEVGRESAGWPAVDLSSGDVYVGQNSRISRYSALGALLERFGQGDVTKASGIAVNTVNSTVYVADLVSDDVVVCTLEDPGPATVEGESVSEVSSGSARFFGEVNPRGAAVEYHFEYGECASVALCPSSGYGSVLPVPSDGLFGGPNNYDVGVVGAHPQDLRPYTVYHLRLVAHNAQFGTVFGEEKVFVTQRLGGPLVSSDGRVAELVSPAPDAHGAQIAPIGETGLAQASADGSSFVYLVSYPTEADPRGFGESEQVLASRGSGGWSSLDIGISHGVPIGLLVGVGREYRFFSEDLNIGLLEWFGPFARPEHEGVEEATPIPTDRTPYFRDNELCVHGPGACYAPVVTGASEGGDVPPNTKFGGIQGTPSGAVSFVGASPDGGHVVVSSEVGLTGAAGLYEWSAALPASERLSPVSVLPESEGGGPAGAPFLGNYRMARHAISSDGSRIIFTGRAPGQEHNHLYMRDTVRDETIRLDLAEGGSGPSQPEALFQTATADGSRVFFVGLTPLTADAGSVGRDLYECEIVEAEQAGKEKLSCVLKDLTPVPAVGHPGAGEAAGVQGSTVGVSEHDGGYVYFVANGVQAEGASPGDCNGEKLRKGQSCSLYVRHAGVTRFVAGLSSDDYPDWEPTGLLNHMISRVSPSGVWFVFMSDVSLTGYDNRDAVSGQRDEEVFLYNAQSGGLVCASCNPTGARPEGSEYSRLNVDNGGLAGGDRVWPETQWVAGTVPGWTPFHANEALYQSRFLGDSGRLFFDSGDGLVAQDTNGDEDVYEFEPVGVGGCVEGSTMFVVSVGGCVGLVSSGVGFGQSAFLDASVSGGDVFFLTSEKMVAADTGSGRDVYDAHECSVVAPCLPVPPVSVGKCASATKCRVTAMGQPTVFGVPASATFSGVGNLSPSGGKPGVKHKALTRAEKFVRALGACKRVSHKKRAACRGRARKRYGPVGSHKAVVVRGVK